ncbi:hypothetical protein J6590_095970, partial [Homalodisca vitripennis]
GSLAYCYSQTRRGVFFSSRSPSLLPVSILFTEEVRRTQCSSCKRRHRITYKDGQGHDIFWASNSTVQGVQLAVGKTVSDKIDCLTLALVTGHRACQISGLTSPYK